VVDTVGIREVRTLMQQAVQVCDLWRQLAHRQIFLDDDDDMIWRPHSGVRHHRRQHQRERRCARGDEPGSH
jgi:hypothetical protein